MDRVIIPKRTEGIKEDFFSRDSVSVANKLLGKTLVRQMTGKDLFASIKEVAAYDGNLISSKYEGLLYAPGTVFVPIQYGHPILGFSTDKLGTPSGVTLISAVVGERGGEGKLVEGSGNVAEVLEIDRDSFDGVPLRLSPMWIGGPSVNDDKILRRNKSDLPKNCRGYFYFR